MRLTAHSNVQSRISPEILRRIIAGVLGEANLAKRVKRRCPAIILAASRTESVRGRMMFLTSSIKTMKGMRGAGVPVGTKCASMEVVTEVQAKSICPNHKGKASLIVQERWLLDVKT